MNFTELIIGVQVNVTTCGHAYIETNRIDPAAGVIQPPKVIYLTFKL